LIFKKELDFSDEAQDKMRMLTVQSQKLKGIQDRLRERDQFVFRRCVNAITNNEEALAKVYADELTKIRGISDFLNRKMVFIECVTIRLETYVEFKSFISDLKPITSVIRDVSGILSTYMPQISGEIQMMNSSLTDILMKTRIDISKASTIVTSETPQSIAVIKEVSSMLEKRLQSALPEPPEFVKETLGKVAQPEIEAVALETSTTVDSIEDSHNEFETLDFFDDILLDYLKQHRGSLNIVKCSNELNLSYDEIRRRLDKLRDLGKIKMAE